MDAARTREAFDRHSLTYDEQFSSLVTARAIRQEIWRIADNLFPAGAHILDLGCGTGDDAIHFAQRGLHVTALDISPRMIAKLILKADAAGLSKQIDARIGDINRVAGAAGGLSDNHPSGARHSFDGIFSNFGALNCLPDVRGLGRLAERTLKPGAPAVLVTMGRFHPLETALFLLKGNFRGAFRRLQRHGKVAVEGIPVSV